MSEEGNLLPKDRDFRGESHPKKRESTKSSGVQREEDLPLLLTLGFDFRREGKVGSGGSSLLLILAHQGVKEARNSEQKPCP